MTLDDTLWQLFDKQHAIVSRQVRGRTKRGLSREAYLQGLLTHFFSTHASEILSAYQSIALEKLAVTLSPVLLKEDMEALGLHDTMKERSKRIAKRRQRELPRIPNSR